MLKQSLLLTFVLLTLTACKPVSKTYTVNHRDDGGYSVSIRGDRRVWSPITPDGVFPTESVSNEIELIGPGKSWAFRNQNGFYYSIDQIKSKSSTWDFGYAWVNPSRTQIYLNLYWVDSPSGSIRSQAFGAYNIPQITRPTSSTTTQ